MQKSALFMPDTVDRSALCTRTRANGVAGPVGVHCAWPVLGTSDSILSHLRGLTLLRETSMLTLPDSPVDFHAIVATLRLPSFSYVPVAS